MKKILCFILILVMTFSFSACSSSDTNKTSSELENEYIIEDMLYETNIEELKKQNPDFEIKEMLNETYIVIKSNFNNMEGEYYYNIKDEEIISSSFNTTVSFYKSTTSTEQNSDGASLPEIDNIEECNKVLEIFYETLKNKYGFSDLTVKAHRKDKGYVQLDNVTNLDEFKECFAPILEGPNSEYNNFVFTGFTDTSKLISVTLANCYYYLSVNVEVTHK